LETEVDDEALSSAAVSTRLQALRGTCVVHCSYSGGLIIAYITTVKIHAKR